MTVGEVQDAKALVIEVISPNELEHIRELERQAEARRKFYEQAVEFYLSGQGVCA